MKILKVDNMSVSIELNYDDVGILHFALYDYLDKVEAKLNKNGLAKPKLKKLQVLKVNLQSMIETINGVI
ncbi:MAG: hypothetical protein PHH14_00655 [Candidatus Margulisbacteria bacterium]|nr:hypothetical protein [Candidatus Margulisiibacteriota bacterium]